MLYTASDEFIQDIANLKGNKQLLIKLEKFINTIENSESILELNNIKKLKGFKNAYRHRIGDYRIGFYLETDGVYLSRIQHRKRIYKLFP